MKRGLKPEKFHRIVVNIILRLAFVFLVAPQTSASGLELVKWQ